MLRRYLLTAFLFFIYTFVYAQTDEKLHQARHLHNSGNFREARDLYRELYLNPKYREIVYNDYINTLVKLEEFTDAEKIIKKRIKENNTKESDKIKLGQLYKSQHQNSLAEKVFDELLRNLPPDASKISQIAHTFYADEDFEMTASTLLNGRKALKNENEFTFELINLYAYQKNKEGLISEVIKAIGIQPEYLPSAKNQLLKTLEANEDYEILKTKLLNIIQRDPQNLAYVELLSWTYIQLQNYQMALIQTIALDKRTNDNGNRVFMLSNLLLSEGEPTIAEKGFNYIISKGKDNPFYVSARIQLLKTRQLLANEKNLADFQSLAGDYQKLIEEFGEGPRTLFAIKELAELKAKKLNQLNEAEALLEKALFFNGLKEESKAELKLLLADIYTLDHKRWDAELLLSQIEKSLPNHPLAQTAKLKNAKLSFYNGDFEWAKTQLEVLKASTSQLIANDALDLSLLIQDNMQTDTSGTVLKKFAIAEFLREFDQPVPALDSLDHILKTYPETELADDILLSKAKIYSIMNQPDNALSCYQHIIDSYPGSLWMDDAIFFSAKILEQEHENDKAKKYYQRLIEEFPASFFIDEARKSFRKLRGDAL